MTNSISNEHPLVVRLKTIRRVFGLSRVRVAAEIGVDPITIIRLEKLRPNVHKPHEATMKKVKDFVVTHEQALARKEAK
jgi:DNA-binding XRE family transcriptional regulator